MRFKDLKIGNQMILLIVFLFAIILMLGSISLYQSSRLWQQTQSLYDHPLKVSRAISAIKTDIILLDNDLEDFLIEKDLRKQNRLLQTIRSVQNNMHDHLRSLQNDYLGPGTDIRKLETGIQELITLTNRVILLAQTGKKAEALQLEQTLSEKVFTPSGIIKDLQSIEATAKQMASRFYDNARNNKKQLARQMFVAVSLLFIFLLTGLLFIYHQAIRTPLRQLTRATKQFSEGNYHTHVAYSSRNEMGQLAEAFNRMVAAIRLQMEREEKAFHFNATLFKRENLGNFTQNLLMELMELTGSQMGAVFLLNKERSEFTLFRSIGLSAKTRLRFSANIKEGEFGVPLSQGKISYLKDLPADTPFLFKTTAGNLIPKEIVTIPIIEKNHTVAMISLAGIHAYNEVARLVLHDIYPSLNARFNGVLLFKKIKEQTQQLEKQNTELEIQGKELAAQSIELSRQNTELKMQKNQLDEANRLKSTFLSNMSHELRTPLNSVIALSSVLKKKLKDSIPEEEYAYIDVIERNGKQLLELINDVLDLSRIESGRVEIDASEIDINGLIREMVTLIAPQADEKKIRLTAKATENLPPLFSDRNKIRHILQNLIGNAVKFTEKGRVEVWAETEGDYLQINVKDTGIGIPEDQLPYIFDEFRQVDSSTSRKYGGTGLGLSIAKKYARMLGGTIEVKSKPGEGSVFTLLLPINPVVSGTSNLLPEKEKGVIQEQTFGPVSGTGKLPQTENPVEKTILIVEDSEPAIIQLKDILTEAGFHVETAAGGQEALEKIAQHVPDAMILDLMMPGVDGYEVLEAVRANAETAALPVLILTAKHLDHRDMKIMEKNHVFQMLQKGDINRKELLNIIRKMVFPEVNTASPAAKKQYPKPSGKKVKRSAEKPLILIVEDNVDNLLTMKSLLGDNFRVMEAYDGQDGVVKAKTYHPDLIFMDIAMPVMNGFRAFDAIRKEEQLKQVPIIAVTASALTADRKEILHYGFDGYIPKPIDINHFEKVLYQFITK